MGPKKRKQDRTAEEQKRIDDNWANKGKQIGKWDLNKMQQAVER